MTEQQLGLNHTRQTWAVVFLRKKVPADKWENIGADAGLEDEEGVGERRVGSATRAAPVVGEDAEDRRGRP